MGAGANPPNRKRRKQARKAERAERSRSARRARVVAPIVAALTVAVFLLAEVEPTGTLRVLLELPVLIGGSLWGLGLLAFVALGAVAELVRRTRQRRQP